MTAILEKLLTLQPSHPPGRLKMKKFVGPVLLAVAGKALALLPFFFGGVVLLVLKAVFVSKLALILAAVLLFQKMSGGGSSGGFSDVLGKVSLNRKGPSIGKLITFFLLVFR
jgi:Protein of unknown function (DUF1676)